MSATFSLPASGLKPIDLLSANALAKAKLSAAGKLADAGKPETGHLSDAAKARTKVAAQKFEAVFLNSMFEQMTSGVSGEGPFGGSGATGVWRSFLTDEYAKSFAKAGGIGIADHVYKTLIAQQEMRQ
jgi:Rod binding domain-containing protein